MVIWDAMRSYVTPSATGSPWKTQAHPKSMGRSSMIKENIDFVFGAMRKMSESLQGSQKPTDHHNKPLWQQNLQSPQLPRPSGHHSQASWVAKHWPVEKGRQGNSKSKTSDPPTKTIHQALDPTKWNLGGHPCPQPATLPDTEILQHPSRKKLKGFRFWLNFLL